MKPHMNVGVIGHHHPRGLASVGIAILGAFDGLMVAMRGHESVGPKDLNLTTGQTIEMVMYPRASVQDSPVLQLKQMSDHARLERAVLYRPPQPGPFYAHHYKSRKYRTR